jgi:hypothetical protein
MLTHVELVLRPYIGELVLAKNPRNALASFLEIMSLSQ